jgi:serine/threonine protein kinase
VLAVRDCIQGTSVESTAGVNFAHPSPPGLEQLHELGFVHRDVSAGNMLIAARHGPFLYQPDDPNARFGFVIDFEFLSAAGQAPEHATQVSVSPCAFVHEHRFTFWF